MSALRATVSALALLAATLSVDAQTPTVKISGLPGALAISGGESIPVDQVQGNQTVTAQTTPFALSTYVLTRLGAFSLSSGQLVIGSGNGGVQSIGSGGSSQVLLGGATPSWGQISNSQLVSGVAQANLGFEPLSPANNLSDLASPSQALINLGAAERGANSTITAMTGLTTPIPLSGGGTGSTGGVGGTAFTSSAPSASSSATSAQRNGHTPNVVDDYGSSLQSALSANASNGPVLLPHGAYAASSPTNLSAGTDLSGSNFAESHSPEIGSAIYATASLSALLTQASLSGAMQNVALRRLTFDGCKAVAGPCASAETVTNVLNLAIENSVIDGVTVANGSGNGMYSTAPTAAWINWIINSQFENNVGIGLYAENSDSLFLGNYFSGNGRDVVLNTTGLRFGFNQVEVSAGDGEVIENHLSTGFPGTAINNIGNYYNLNTTADVHYEVGAGSSHTMRGPSVGNIYHDSSGVKIDNNVNDGLLAGESFDNATCDVTWNANGAGSPVNTNWQLIGTSHTLSPASRFCNLPADTQLITGGPGGVLNRLQSLILTSPTGQSIATPDTRLNVFGSDSVLGQTNVEARFGVSRNSSGLDAAILVGSKNGNAPFIDAVNGETTTVTSLSLDFQHVQAVAITSAAVISEFIAYFNNNCGGVMPANSGWGALCGNYSNGGSEVDLFDNSTSATSTTLAIYQKTGASTETLVALFGLSGATFPTLPTSAGTGGLYVCVDSTGKEYKKSACP